MRCTVKYELLVLCSCWAVGSGYFDSSPTWTCKDKKCTKSSTIETDTTTHTTCMMVCDDLPPLWPKPKEIKILKKNSTSFFPENIFLKILAPALVKSRLEEAAEMFLKTLPKGDGYNLYDEQQPVKLEMHVNSDQLLLTSLTNESYVLYSQKLASVVHVNIFADNYYGARLALETLSQLIWYDAALKRHRILHDVMISDQPSFGHRGLMIDVSRHYFSVPLLKKAIEGMAASKLNVLHLHMSDSASFPLKLPHNEQLARGAYSDEEVYSPEDIRSLIEYGRLRGIRTVIEIDAPSHVSPEAWPEEEILCQNPDMFRTTLNPDNPKAMDRLENIYRDLLELGTDKDTFHIGDDEVVTDCWESTDAAKTQDIYTIWSNFTNQMMKRVKMANNGSIPRNIVLWSSPLTDRYLEKLDHRKDIVVQYWFGQFKHILDKGYKIIFSTVGQWYLDCGFGPWKKDQFNGACDPYTHWKKFYQYRPWNTYSNQLNQILGGEVCLWTEQVSADDFETRLWPRTAAFAERVWSDPEIFIQDDVFKRIDFFSRRLTERGLRVAAIWPEICSLYPDRC